MLPVVTRSKTENVDDKNQVVIDDVVNNDSETSDVHLNNAMTSEMLFNEQAIDGSFDPCFKSARAGKRDLLSEMRCCIITIRCWDSKSSNCFYRLIVKCASWSWHTRITCIIKSLKKESGYRFGGPI